jgi:hypothetical protein
MSCGWNQQYTMPSHKTRSCSVSFLTWRRHYDMVWKRGILRTLKQWNVQGNMYHLVDNFLHNRSFRLRINDILSSEKDLQNGCPQGSVLSVTLFLSAINGINSAVSFPIQTSIYEDYLILYTKGTENHVQNALIS